MNAIPIACWIHPSLKEGEEKPTKTRTLLALVRARSGGKNLLFPKWCYDKPWIHYCKVTSLPIWYALDRVPQLRSSLQKSHHQLDNMKFSPNKKKKLGGGWTNRIEKNIIYIYVVKMGIFHRKGWKLKIFWNHHPKKKTCTTSWTIDIWRNHGWKCSTILPSPFCVFIKINWHLIWPTKKLPSPTLNLFFLFAGSLQPTNRNRASCGESAKRCMARCHWRTLARRFMAALKETTSTSSKSLLWRVSRWTRGRNFGGKKTSRNWRIWEEKIQC